MFTVYVDGSQLTTEHKYLRKAKQYAKEKHTNIS